MPELESEHIHDLAADLLRRVLAGEATDADVIAIRSNSRSARIRNGEIEEIAGAENFDIGLRAICDHRQAVVSTSRTDRSALDELVERALAMAKAAPEDRYVGLPDEALYSELTADDLDLFDDTEIPTEELITRAKIAEAAALACEGITNTEGAESSAGSGEIVLVNSGGFHGSYRSSIHGISATAVAGDRTGMERDYDYASARFFTDLPSPETVGRLAGERAVKRLQPKKPRSGSFPVLFHPRVGRSLLGHFGAAINGEAVARGTSFLRDCLDERVFEDGISIVDDSLRRRGLRSRPFDGEGVQPQTIRLIENGTLTSWLLDSATGKRLGIRTTGHASRSAAAAPAPSPTNLYLEAGKIAPEELIGMVSSGLYVCELIGMGVNLVTGDYSRGAAGFWIENGEITHPVSELTIAGNLREMFANLQAASDLEFRYATNTPTLLIPSLTIAGQ